MCVRVRTHAHTHAHALWVAEEGFLYGHCVMHSQVWEGRISPVDCKLQPVTTIPAVVADDVAVDDCLKPFIYLLWSMAFTSDHGTVYATEIMLPTILNYRLSNSEGKKSANLCL